MNTATRRRGVFLTPLAFAEKGYRHVENSIGKQWWQSGNYRLWDMAAGTGNLEIFLPQDSHKYCYLSTLEPEDVQHLGQKFPLATVFQYDYLEDDAVKLPDALRNDLANPEIRWIILINPPYATAQEAGLKGTSKGGVADTRIRKQMHTDGLGEVSRELYVQFLYRVMYDFQDRETILGLFSPIKYLVSTNYQKFRDRIFRAKFLSGFIFSSENFGGTSKTSHFPVAFILWDIQTNICPEFGILPFQGGIEKIDLDILDSTAKKIGVKTLTQANRDIFLSRWIKRPRGTSVFPPFSSALTVKSGNVDTRNRTADGFLASLMCPGNELQNQQQTAFLSGPQVSAGALSVTPENFEQAVVVFAARRIPKDSWINHVDQLLRPNRKLSPQFVADCAVWSLFDNKNQTVSLRNVEYRGKVYQVVNHFFPFSVAEVLSWVSCGTAVTGDFSLCPLWNLCVSCGKKITARDTRIKIPHRAQSDSFVADWLLRQKFSAEAEKVLTIAKAIYRFYFVNLHLLRKTEFKIESYDAGWYQIRQALLDAKLGDDMLADLKHCHDRLKEKLLPQLYDYGVLYRT